MKQDAGTRANLILKGSQIRTELTVLDLVWALASYAESWTEMYSDARWRENTDTRAVISLITTPNKLLLRVDWVKPVWLTN